MINADGRGRAFVNDQPVGVTLLRQLGEVLFEQMNLGTGASKKGKSGAWSTDQPTVHIPLGKNGRRIGSRHGATIKNLYVGSNGLICIVQIKGDSGCVRQSHRTPGAKSFSASCAARGLQNTTIDRRQAGVGVGSRQCNDQARSTVNSNIRSVGINDAFNINSSRACATESQCATITTVQVRIEYHAPAASYVHRMCVYGTIKRIITYSATIDGIQTSHCDTDRSVNSMTIASQCQGALVVVIRRHGRRQPGTTTNIKGAGSNIGDVCTS
ncbi:hypothetical protein WCLP8_2450001 [uncultured Gammaproteobacteria bacterium]